MICTAATSWTGNDFCMGACASAVEQSPTEIAMAIYARVCRTDFQAPGFCLLDLGSEPTSESFRRIMIRLAAELRKIEQERRGRDLHLLSAARFDQQVTTKPHRDGGPDECFLMLGYEPSKVQAEVELSDYSRCAFDMGLTPQQFLERHNPMFTAGARILRDYTTGVSCFNNRHYQILFINNSAAPYSEEASAWQGVLHTATIVNPDESVRRVVNSLMAASVLPGAIEPVSEAEREAFMTTSLVRRRGYDRTNLEEDS
jgi:hypothetical protein